MKSRIHIFVYGMVQGVFFRANTVSKSDKLGLTGWVRNRKDGCVEILAEGEIENLKELLEWSKHGPAPAAVKSVKHEWQDFQGEFSEFKRIETV